MAQDIIQIKSISQLHQKLGIDKPKHPLISIIDADKLRIKPEEINLKIAYDFYSISLKDKSCGIQYGRNSLDFEEGVMIFSSPGQIYTTTQVIEAGDIDGWMLFFHPDLIRQSNLYRHMDDYSFFNYEVFEALHLSEIEENTINNTVENIRSEYEQRIDNHSQRVICTNLELLLNYCLRYYERQFNTRSNHSVGIVRDFEMALKEYFNQQMNVENGLPSIQYFAQKSHLSQHYFSDLIKKETGRSPKDHINDFVIEKAKDLILEQELSISEIAYDLGFNYPHYFTRLFKSKTGLTPIQYRNMS